MTEEQKMQRLIEYIALIKSEQSVSRARICDDIKLRKVKLKDGTKCVKVLIKIPERND